MRNCSRNKFMLCFRPSGIDLDDQVIDCIDGYNNKKHSFRRSFSAVFKPHFGQNNMSKRHEDIKRSKSHGQLNTESDESDSNSDSATSPTSPCSPIGSSDHREPGNSQNCLEKNREEKNKKNKRKLRRESNLGLNNIMYLVVLSLLFTVISTKSLAVVVTTVWIFFVRNINVKVSEGKTHKSVEKRSWVGLLGSLLECSSCLGFSIPTYFT